LLPWPGEIQVVWPVQQPYRYSINILDSAIFAFVEDLSSAVAATKRTALK
jgi:hypothetical protein